MENNKVQCIKLPQPKLMDLTKGDHSGTVHILTRPHKFAAQSAVSGQDPTTAPIFGTKAWINGKLISDITFGLPFFRVKQGQAPHVNIINRTGFTFDLHWHGLNTTADVDGASSQTEFGVGTKIGPFFDLHFPTIRNNATLLWVHAHPMLRSSPFTYAGVNGLVDIIDDASECAVGTSSGFQYGDNHLMLLFQDLDLNADGSLTSVNLYTDEARACFGVINGICCVNWYSNDPSPYVDRLYHKVQTNNLVKIDILNSTSYFRYIYVGVCDKHKKIKPFQLIQTDGGLVNPALLTMVEVPPSTRRSILIDLEAFDEELAYVFLYNFELTEVFQANPSNPSNPNDPSLQALTPDLTQSSNPTPNPTPIPDPNGLNPQDDPSALSYPTVPLIPQINQRLQNGNVFPPQKTKLPYTIKEFLKIRLCKKHKPNLLDKIKNLFSDAGENDNNSNKCYTQTCLADKIRQIRQVVFGPTNYRLWKAVIKKPHFEYTSPVNYLTLLNSNYYYNIPDFHDSPIRNFILFGNDDEDSNTVDPNGSTEYIAGANRLFVDMWNSKELNLEFALVQYNLAPNNYQPSLLPTCLFKIYPTTTSSINYQMLGNDTLIVQFFASPIAYGDLTTVPLASATIVFPPTNPDVPLNIQQWKALVTSNLATTLITVDLVTTPLSTYLQYDWTFYPYKVTYVYEKSELLKSVMMKTTNTSPYYIRFLGSWQLLQFFGKPISAAPANTMGSGSNAVTTSDGSVNYDMNLPMMTPQYATDDPNNQIPIVGTVGPASLAQQIIAPQSTYLGFIDGFQSDDLMNFSVRRNSSEQWNYHNLDTQDSHPFHFHLTSGFVDPSNRSNSAGLVSKQRSYASYLYSNDTYGIGPQQSISWYLKFNHFVSTESSLNPPVRGLGYMYHCHFATHHEMNMMGQYFVYRNRSDYF